MPGSVDYVPLLTELGSPQFTHLRSAQSETLALYTTSHTGTPDLAIELPTGAGKSLIALLIAEAWRRDGKRAAILTGNKTLARQMEGEARALGIGAVRFEGSGAHIPPPQRRSYQRANSIAIMNYWVYFNQNPAVDPADLLIMDDAHLAEHCLHSLYSVEVSRFDHPRLFEVLITELSERYPEYAALQDALDPDAPSIGRAELLSFLDQDAVADRLREVIDSSPDLENPDLRFRWMRLRDLLRESNLYLSKNSLWLRPYIYPLTRNRHYAEPQQRIYMSATIGDTGDLARRLGTLPIQKLRLSPQHAETTYGRRLVVINQVEEADIPERLSRVILAALSLHPKALWLCASRSEADRLKTTVVRWLSENGISDHPTWTLTSLGDEIDEFKRASKGHLFVAGRFDGMDFRADECRLVILATLPKAINIQEEFFTAYLRDAEFMVRRLNQQIVQALGRCNRSADDFGVYVLADRRFATHFGREANRADIPPNIVAEIDSAEDLTQAPQEQLVQRVTAFLRQDFSEFDEDLQQHREAVPQARESGDPTSACSADEVQGWAELFGSQNYVKAQEHFRTCSDALRAEDLREVGAFLQWCEAKAAHLRGRQGDRDAQRQALELLEGAIERGGRSSWFNRLRSSLNRQVGGADRANRGLITGREYVDALLQVFDERLERLGTGGTAFDRWANGLTAKLECDGHAQYVEGLKPAGATAGILAFSSDLRGLYRLPLAGHVWRCPGSRDVRSQDRALGCGAGNALLRRPSSQPNDTGAAAIRAPRLHRSRDDRDPPGEARSFCRGESWRDPRSSEGCSPRAMESCAHPPESVQGPLVSSRPVRAIRRGRSDRSESAARRVAIASTVSRWPYYLSGYSHE